MKSSRAVSCFTALMLFAFLLIAGSGQGRATLLPGSYNISGTCTAACGESFSGMFDVVFDSNLNENLIVNFMMEFNVTDPFSWSPVSLVTTDMGTMFEGEVANIADHRIIFDDLGTWAGGFRGIRIGASDDISPDSVGTYGIVMKAVPEPPTAALLAAGLFLMVWLARRRRAGSPGAYAARWVPGIRT